MTIADDALGAGRWSDACIAFEHALEDCETAEALMGLGQALWWLGETRRSVEYHERAYVAFRRQGDAEQAAWAAMWLGLTYGSDFGNHAAFQGWIARAEHVLQDAAPGPVLGRLWLIQAYDTSDLARSQVLTERVLDLARECGDVDLELCALAHLGYVLIARSRTEEGFALIDGALAGTFGGERNRFDTVVFTSCAMMAACERAADVERATQWCRMADAFIREYGCPFLHAQCRIAYGGILAAVGRWAEAEEALTSAIHVTGGDAFPPMHAQALARLAELRLAQGRLEEAEYLLADVGDQHCCIIARARTALARDEPAVAVALLERLLDAGEADRLEAAVALELLVASNAACGRFEAAAAVAERLRSLVLEGERGVLAARAASAEAYVSMARAERRAAKAKLEEALHLFSRLHLRLDAARTRIRLARVLEPERPELAAAEARAAVRAFDALGAAMDADAARALLRDWGVAERVAGPRTTGVLTPREQEVLRLIGLGLSNPEIARRLYISKKTASHHAARVLAKLGLRNRAEAAAYCARTAK